MKAMKVGLSVLILGLGMAFAASHTGGRFLAHPSENDLLASELMGAPVFVTETEVDVDVVVTENGVEVMTVEEISQDWENVADVNDFLLAPDGTIRGVLVDVGGFLGIGGYQVMVGMEALNFVRQQDSDELYVVFTSTREELEEAPEYQDDPTAGEMSNEDEASTDETQAEEARRLGVPEEQMEGFETVDVGTLTVDELTSASVYDRLNEPVSDIHDVQLAAEGEEVVAVLIDVGGFLGLGARTVAVAIDQIEIQMDPERDDLRVYLNMTREELENLPEYDE